MSEVSYSRFLGARRSRVFTVASDRLLPMSTQASHTHANQVPRHLSQNLANSEAWAHAMASGVRYETEVFEDERAEFFQKHKRVAAIPSQHPCLPNITMLIKWLETMYPEEIAAPPSEDEHE